MRKKKSIEAYKLILVTKNSKLFSRLIYRIYNLICFIYMNNMERNYWSLNLYKYWQQFKENV